MLILTVATVLYIFGIRLLYIYYLAKFEGRKLDIGFDQTDHDFPIKKDTIYIFPIIGEIILPIQLFLLSFLVLSNKAFALVEAERLKQEAEAKAIEAVDDYMLKIFSTGEGVYNVTKEHL